MWRHVLSAKPQTSRHLFGWRAMPTLSVGAVRGSVRQSLHLPRHPPPPPRPLPVCLPLCVPPLTLPACSRSPLRVVHCTVPFFPHALVFQANKGLLFYATSILQHKFFLLPMNRRNPDNRLSCRIEKNRNLPSIIFLKFE